MPGVSPRLETGKGLIIVVSGGSHIFFSIRMPTRSSATGEEADYELSVTDGAGANSQLRTLLNGASSTVPILGGKCR